MPTRRALLAAAALAPLPVAPALAEEATPAAGETLLDVVLPAGLIPAGPEREAALVPVAIPAGAEGTWPGATVDPGLRVDYVLAGTYAVLTEDPAHLVRPGGAPLEVLAGSEVELGPGDAWIARLETAFAYANRGAEPAALLVWMLTERHAAAPPLPLGWVFRHDYGQHRVAAPPDPATLRLRRIAVAAGEAVAVLAGGFQVAIAVPAAAGGTPVAARLGTASDGTVRNVGREPVALYVATLEPAAAGRG